MIRMFVRHTVNDFAQWKQGYDAFGAVRSEMGVRAEAVFVDTANPNDVTVWHDFETLEAAQDFVASDQLREAMQNAGVTGDPLLWFAEQA